MIIILNLQTKLYAIQFSHHLMTDSQSVPEQQLRNLEITDFENFAKLPTKAKLPEKFKLLDKRGFEPTENKRHRFLPPG